MTNPHPFRMLPRKSKSKFNPIRPLRRRIIVKLNQRPLERRRPRHHRIKKSRTFNPIHHITTKPTVLTPNPFHLKPRRNSSARRQGTPPQLSTLNSQRILMNIPGSNTKPLLTKNAVSFDERIHNDRNDHINFEQRSQGKEQHAHSADL